MKWHKCLLALLLGAAAGCGAQGHVQPQTPRPEGVSKETFEYIVRLETGRMPWTKATKETLGLRRRTFLLEEELMKAGRTVRRSSEAAGTLELKLEGSATATCSERPAFRATLRNLTGKPMRLCDWIRDCSLELVSAEGHCVPLPHPAALHRNDHEVPIPTYFTLKAGETIRLKLPPGEYQWPRIPPGRYHVTATTGASLEPIDARKSWPLTSNTVAVELVARPRAREMECALTADADEMAVGEDLVLRAGLHNLSELHTPLVLRTSLGFTHFIIRDPATGEERKCYAALKRDPSWFTPQMGWPREKAYARVSPGEWLWLEYTLKAAEWKRLGGFLRPGRTYEITWHYSGLRRWFLGDDGKVYQWTHVWIGRLTSEPVRIRIKPAADP